MAEKDSGFPVSEPLLAAVQSAVERIDEVLEEEMTALRVFSVPDLSDFNDRKARGLQQLTRAMRAIDSARANSCVLPVLSGLRDRLEQNRQLLLVHLNATREITEIISNVMVEARSDGTYSQTVAGQPTTGRKQRS